MNVDHQVLVDSDAFVGWFLQEDAHHQKVEATLEKVRQQKLETITTSLVVAETATVLSNRSGQDLARRFLRFTQQLPIIHIDEELFAETIDLFTTVDKKGTSIVDCSNVVVMKLYSIPYIFSFDRVYRRYDLEMLA